MSTQLTGIIFFIQYIEKIRRWECGGCRDFCVVFNLGFGCRPFEIEVVVDIDAGSHGGHGGDGGGRGGGRRIVIVKTGRGLLGCS